MSLYRLTSNLFFKIKKWFSLIGQICFLTIKHFTQSGRSESWILFQFCRFPCLWWWLLVFGLICYHLLTNYTERSLSTVTWHGQNCSNCWQMHIKGCLAHAFSRYVKKGRGNRMFVNTYYFSLNLLFLGTSAEGCAIRIRTKGMNSLSLNPLSPNQCFLFR